MAVKVGNSWVSEAALSYAKVKADSGESATLNGLLDRYPGVNFSTNTQAFLFFTEPIITLILQNYCGVNKQRYTLYFSDTVACAQPNSYCPFWCMRLQDHVRKIRKGAVCTPFHAVSNHTKPVHFSLIPKRMIRQNFICWNFFPIDTINHFLQHLFIQPCLF